MTPDPSPTMRAALAFNRIANMAQDALNLPRNMVDGRPTPPEMEIFGNSIPSNPFGDVFNDPR